MFPHRFLPQSLKTRVTLITLLIVVVGFLILGFYSKSLLREELLLHTGQQQRSVLNLLASEVDRGLRERLATLQTVASRMATGLPQNPEGFRDFLQQQSFLAVPFNAGISFWDQQGVLLANVQFSPDGLDPPAPAAEDLAQVLRDGQPVVGRMQLSEKRDTAWFAMAVPVRGPAGDIIGALAGVTRLDQANFLSRLTTLRFGKTGHFFLVDTSQRLIFASSDQTRQLELLPAPGENPWIDRFVQGFEGTARMFAAQGGEALISAQQIPLARWYVSVTQAPEESFDLIDPIKLRARLLGLVLVLLCLGLIWAMLRHQLAPMTAAVRMLDGFVRKNQTPKALPVVLQDEVGQLVGGFNSLLDTLAQQQEVLRQSELFKQAVLNSVAAKIAVLDQNGVILAVNQAWLQHDSNCLPTSGHSLAAMKVGTDFLAACDGLEADAAQGDAVTAQAGIGAVLAGRMPRFYLEYANHSPLQQRWFSMSVTPLDGKAIQGAVVSLEEITSAFRWRTRCVSWPFTTR